MIDSKINFQKEKEKKNLVEFSNLFNLITNNHIQYKIF